MGHKIPNSRQIGIWKNIWKKYKDQLEPNRKTGKELIAFIKNNYSIEYIEQERLISSAVENLSQGVESLYGKETVKNMDAKLLKIVNKDKGCKLYDVQESDFKGLAILVGVDMNTGYFVVEGSMKLHEELTIFAGLSKEEIDNFFIVANYIECLEKYGKLNEVVKNKSDK